MTLFVEIVYIFVTVVLILVVLLQAGKGGGLGTALGGGASQGVFGGGGGADFLAKLTQGLAAGFMICAVYLAYASAHTGSSRLEDASTDEPEMFAEDEAVDYERVGEGVPQPLPDPGTEADVIPPAAITSDTPSVEEVEKILNPEGSIADELGEPGADAAPTADTTAEPATDAEAPTAEPEPTTPAEPEPTTAEPEPTTPAEPEPTTPADN